MYFDTIGFVIFDKSICAVKDAASDTANDNNATTVDIVYNMVDQVCVLKVKEESE